MKNAKKVLSVALAATLALSSVAAVQANENVAPGEDNPVVDNPLVPTEPSEPTEPSKPSTDPTTQEPTITQTTPAYNDSHQDMNGATVISGILLVNKQNPLPDGYAPTYTGSNGQSTTLQGEADAAAQNFLAACNAQGHNMYILSGYRSYNVQQNLFASYAASYGEARANTFSARAGQSEHQTGLAFDVGDANHSSYNLQTSMENLASIQWMMANCAEYGFILRFPKDKVDITGYQYEPWHYRYVGVAAAREIMHSGLCLEEFLGVAENSSGRVMGIGRSNNSLCINGSYQNVASYNIGGNNYFRLRDLATILIGTEANFDVGYDDVTRTIAISSHTALTQSPSLIELSTNDVGTPNNMPIMVDGAVAAPTAYNINGFTYFKLRDLGQILGFNVDWDQESQSMVINTKGNIEMNNLLASVIEH